MCPGSQHRQVQLEDDTCNQLDVKVCFVLQFVNKDIIPLDGPATIKAAYKLWKQTASKQKRQPASEKWQRLSKAETGLVPPKTSDTLKVHAQAASEDQV